MTKSLLSQWRSLEQESSVAPAPIKRSASASRESTPSTRAVSTERQSSRQSETRQQKKEESDAMDGGHDKGMYRQKTIMINSIIISLHNIQYLQHKCNGTHRVIIQPY